MSECSGRQSIILDRDGVINRESKEFIKSADEFECLPGSVEAMARLCHAHWNIVIVTNQSGLGRGLFSEQDLFAMHAKLEGELAALGGAVAGIFYCPHAPDHHCDCRKPKTGLLLNAERQLYLQLKGAPFVGDSLRDLQAARAHACVPVLVRTGNGGDTEAHISRLGEWSDVAVYDDLAAVTEDLLSRA